MCGWGILASGRRSLLALVLLAVGATASAAPVDRSDMNGDGAVDIFDLQIFSEQFLEQDWQTVDWCAFHDASISDPKYFREITSDKIQHYQQLMDFIALAYDCDGTAPEDDQSDLNFPGRMFECSALPAGDRDVVEKKDRLRPGVAGIPTEGRLRIDVHWLTPTRWCPAASS